jgi:hypothetical protein
MVEGGGENFPLTDTDISFNIDILVRQADGTLRETLATGVAAAELSITDKGTWVTLTGIYSFPGYSVIYDNDYLEIVFYGQTAAAPEGAPGTLQISIDNRSLPVSDQTKIEAL